MNWISLFVTKNIYKAELLKNALEEHGISAVKIDKIDHNYPVFGEVEIRINGDDKEKAEEILKQIND